MGESAEVAVRKGSGGAGEGAAGGGGTGVRSVRRGKVNSDRKLAYARLQGTGRGALDYRVRKKSVTIGRKGGGADCQIKVESTTVSRLHAKLEWSNAERKWRLSCVSRKNGVLVDGVPLAYGMDPMPLRSCQLIELGDVGLFFLGPKSIVRYTHDIAKTEEDMQRKRKAKAELAQRPTKQAKKDEKKAAAHQKKPANKGNAAAKKLWTKRDKSDFLRAMFTTGIKKDETGKVDWVSFRHHAGGLTQKDDESLMEYHEKLMKDVQMVIDISNNISGKGRRTQHKENCECVICEHSRRKAARIANGTARAEDLEGNKSEEEEEQDVEREKLLAEQKKRMDSALVSLVTAQKLRVRLGLIEAANDVDTPPGVAALEKLSTQAPKPAPSGETLPSWWVAGKHDRELMLGVTKHGVGKWEAIWEDETLDDFATVKDHEEGFPHARAAMRRLRDVSSAILAEKRRRAKKGKVAPKSTRKKSAPQKPEKAPAGKGRPRSQSPASSADDISGSDEREKDPQESEDGSDENGSDDEDDEDDEDEEEEEEDEEENGDNGAGESIGLTPPPPGPRRAPPGPPPVDDSNDEDEDDEDEDEDDQMEVEEIVEEVEESDDEDE